MTPRARRILSLAAAALALSVASADAKAPAGRYVVSAQTVLDTKTNLTWERSFTDLLTFEGASDRCAKLGATLGGSWRLPTVKELFTIVDYTTPQPGILIDTDAFGPGGDGVYWTTKPNGTEPIQCVNFFSGRNGCEPDLNLSRCVR
jgi:hypothetical protein